MCSIRLFQFMATGWRGYLEEESEYQWIAMAGFLVFILLGAAAIQGTSNLPGVSAGPSNASHAEVRVLDIDYGSDGSFIAKVVTDTGIDLYMHNSDASVTKIIDSSESVDASEIEFLTPLANGNVAISPAANTVMVIHSPVNVPTGEALISTLEMDNSTGDFEILDLAEKTFNSESSWLMVTDEGSSTGLRGFGSIGQGSVSADTISTSMASAVLSMPTSDTADVVWQHVASVSGNLWGASGYISFASDVSGASAASPTIVPVVAVVEWDNSIDAPTIKAIHTGDTGTVHTLLELDDSTVFAAGTRESTLIDSSGEMVHIDQGSVAAVVDDSDRVWLFGDVGSKTIMRYDQGTMELLPLGRPLSFAAEASGFGMKQISLHGVDELGFIKTLNIDTSASSSIESGRGFLTFMFLSVFTIVMLVMAWSVSERFLNARRS